MAMRVLSKATERTSVRTTNSTRMYNWYTELQLRSKTQQTHKNPTRECTGNTHYCVSPKSVVVSPSSH
jgi:hypothetical protein